MNSNHQTKLPAKSIVKNNSPPAKTTLPTMCGIDSLHLLVECSVSELTALIKKCGLGISMVRQTKWTTEYKIILAGESIRIVVTRRQKCHLEFGGLYYNKNSSKKLCLIRDITRHFQKWKLSRIDFACDLKVGYKTIDVHIPEGYVIGKQYRDTVYFNRRTKARTLTICIYDRSRHIDLFSFPLTRVEVRVFSGAFSNRKMGECLQECEALEKCAGLIENILLETLHISVSGEAVTVAVNVTEVLHNFVEFLQSDRSTPVDKDLFHIKEAFVVRDKVLTYMKATRLSWQRLTEHCKMKKAKVSSQIGISQPILRKALEFAKGA